MSKISSEVLTELIKPMEGESDKAYQAFCQYAMLPESKRMQKIAFPLLSPTTHLTESTLKEYAKDYRWNERVSKITAYLLKHHIEEQQKQNVELLGEFLETNRAVKRETVENVKKASSVLTKLLDKVSDGIESEDFKFKPTDIASIFTAMEKGIKLVNEIPTDIINNRPISNRNVNEIQDLNELEELEDQIRRELAGETIETTNIQ